MHVCLFAFVCRTVLRWRCTAINWLWRQTHCVCVLCTRPCLCIDKWATHRLRFKLLAYCTQWVMQCEWETKNLNSFVSFCLKLRHLLWEVQPVHVKVTCVHLRFGAVKPEPSLVRQTLMLPSATQPPRLLSPASLLRSQSVSSLLSVPSAQSVLHAVAQKCVRSGRWGDHHGDPVAPCGC